LTGGRHYRCPAAEHADQQQEALLSPKRIGIAAGLGIATVMLGTPHSAAIARTNISTKWSAISITLERCKSRAEDAMRDAGFRNVQVLQFSVYGERGEYSAMVRCAPEKGVVFFVVAGPQVERVNRYVDNIGDGF